MDRGDWQVAVHRVAKTQARVSNFQLHFLCFLTLKDVDLGIPLISFVLVLTCSPPHFPTPALTPYHNCTPLAQLLKHLS